LTFLSLSFHEFLKRENEVGNITRQEAVSMVGTWFFFSGMCYTIYVLYISWVSLVSMVCIVAGPTTVSECATWSSYSWQYVIYQPCSQYLHLRSL